ncbi:MULTISPECIES: hypothetical protein [Bacillus cereus group]|uniref:Uncharacterized protein n=1 Tax=Bacillus paranthracis TaxID=2026186 RepID=A0A7D8H803_9BACI|nr:MULTISPECIES: hypothetical protein [Bacillus cereus group]ANT40281.1 hypothetical protein [Bacillus phage PfNC7401]ANT40351.1 hypothetical protein [Bacillus phage PfIS075]EEK97149.1 hypothetical protein bcere0013_57120 [Bacillus cereus BDRD-ST26]EJP82546.1 hypothetical protein IAU_05762 [Bacillus cereus IS075]EOO82166.1 hypothetical protein IGS_05929 [Bacillus cereus IS845/00]EOO95286.1 hypothetical protein IGQ_04045 [Bacillus cereus IS195]BAL21522.1 hypothetical protein BCN_C1_47 [Bacill
MLFDDVQAPSKPYCDICVAAIDNIDIHEVRIEEKEMTACSICYGDPTVRRIDSKTLFDLIKSVGKRYGYRKSIREVQQQIEVDVKSIEIDVLEKMEGHLLRQPTGKKIEFSVEELLYIFNKLRLQIAGHNNIAFAVAQISERGIEVVIRKDDDYVRV